MNLHKSQDLNRIRDFCVEDPLGNGHMTDSTPDVRKINNIKVTHGVEVLDTWTQPLCILYNVTRISTYDSQSFSISIYST